MHEDQGFIEVVEKKIKYLLVWCSLWATSLEIPISLGKNGLASRAWNTTQEFFVKQNLLLAIRRRIGAKLS
jgi:hypothetical protein